MPSIFMIDTKDAGDKKEKDKKLGDIRREAPKSKTLMKEDILEELRVDKFEWADIAHGCLARNFWNCAAREVIVVFEDSVGPIPDKSDGGTTVVIDCGAYKNVVGQY